MCADKYDHEHTHGKEGGCNHENSTGHHDHAAHADLDSADGRRRVAIACVITALFAVVEVIGGVISGSLALLADAAHMFTDSASLALAWFGYWFATKEPDETRSFGFGRMRVLAAFTNGIVLLGLAVWIMVEGILRLLDPQPVIGSMMLTVAIGGLIVNLVAFYILHNGNNDDINLSGALWHVIGDLLGSLAAILAAIVIMATSWTVVDPLLSMLVALLVLVAGARITHRAGHILVQGAPKNLTPAIIHATLLEKIDGIKTVQNVHVWLLTEDKPIATVCVTADNGVCTDELRISTTQYLKEQLNVHLTTVEVVAEGQETENHSDNISAGADQKGQPSPLSVVKSINTKNPSSSS